MYTYIKALGLHLANSKCLINVGYIYYLFDVFPPSLDYNVRKSKDPGLYLKPQHSVWHVGTFLSLYVEGVRSQQGRRSRREPVGGMEDGLEGG